MILSFNLFIQFTGKSLQFLNEVSSKIYLFIDLYIGVKRQNRIPRYDNIRFERLQSPDSINTINDLVILQSFGVNKWIIPRAIRRSKSVRKRNRINFPSLLFPNLSPL